jgi:hypothetical protein
MVEQLVCAIKDLTQAQITEMCNKATTVAPVIIIYIVTLLFFTIFGLSFVKKNRGRLALILVLTALFSAAVLIWLLLSPNLVNNIVQWWIKVTT